MSPQTDISRRRFLAFGLTAMALVRSGAATAQSLDPTQRGPYGLPLQGPFNPPPPGVVQSQPNGYQSSPDQAAARQQVSNAIRDQLGKVGQLQGNTLAVHFSISSASSPPPSDGFTSPVPFNSVAPPPEGVMVMELSPPEALIDRFSVSASMSVMSAQYSDANGARHRSNAVTSARSVSTPAR